MQIDFISTITLGAIMLSAIVNIAVLTGKREAQASADTRRDVKLDNILEKTNYIAARQKAIEDTLKQHIERIIVVEQSNKAMWHRLDDIMCKSRFKEE